MNMYSYQTALLDKLNQGGFKQGEIMLFYAGRQSGKSMLNQMYGSITQSSAKFSILDQAQVDGETWYTVAVYANEVSIWLREQSQELQHSHDDNLRYLFKPTFDIHEKLYTLLALKWS
jgi:hypothetical protein